MPMWDLAIKLVTNSIAPVWDLAMKLVNNLSMGQSKISLKAGQSAVLSKGQASQKDSKRLTNVKLKE